MAVLGPGWPMVVVLCLGVWLHAADSLLAATVMPSAVAEIGGLAFIYWTVALYQLGSIVAGAVTGILTLRFGLGTAMTLAALVYAGGCALERARPGHGVMLLGRLLQGCGGGWMVALSHVGLTQLFPPERWPQLLAVISGVWGVSALTGPLIGGASRPRAVARRVLGVRRAGPGARRRHALLLGRAPSGRTGTAEPVAGGAAHPGAQRRRGGGARRRRPGRRHCRPCCWERSGSACWRVPWRSSAGATGCSRRKPSICAGPGGRATS